MISVKDLVNRLRVFERNKYPLDLKIIGLAIYFQTSSLRRTARILSEFKPISKTAVWKWIVKLKLRLRQVN